jgi:hypothetical protein
MPAPSVLPRHPNAGLSPAHRTLGGPPSAAKRATTHDLDAEMLTHKVRLKPEASKKYVCHDSKPTPESPKFYVFKANEWHNVPHRIAHRLNEKAHDTFTMVAGARKISKTEPKFEILQLRFPVKPAKLDPTADMEVTVGDMEHDGE